MDNDKNSKVVMACNLVAHRIVYEYQFYKSMGTSFEIESYVQQWVEDNIEDCSTDFHDSIMNAVINQLRK